MVTAPKTSSTGAAFTKAPNDSAFGKVFLNNMDENSFSIDTKRQIALMILNSKTAFFNDHTEVVAQQEYSNCQVKKIKIVSSKKFIDYRNIILDREGLV